MKKELLIELFAEAKFNTSKYDGDLSGRTYWEGVMAAYQNLLNRMYSGWATQKGRGRDVWACGQSDEKVLGKATENVVTWTWAIENDVPSGTELQPLK
jgi:hypothetical protein